MRKGKNPAESNRLQMKDFTSSSFSLHALLFKAHGLLEPNSIPANLPGVQDNYNGIRSHLIHAIHCNRDVSGVPGTGKTVTVMSVINDLQNTSEKRFDTITINGMHCTESKSIYSKLWEKITGSSLSARLSAEKLGKLFLETPTLDIPLILVVDELDVLITKDQNVVYNLFDWPNLPGSNLIVVAIANTNDLPERLLSNRVSSRLGLSHIDFKPYDFKQLKQIIVSRLEDAQVFEPDAIEYCSRKLASISGDARRLLDVHRRAIELIEERLQECSDVSANEFLPIGIKWIDAVLKETYQSSTIKCIKHCTLYQKLLLISYVNSLSRNSSKKAHSLQSIIKEYVLLLNIMSIKDLDINGINTCIRSLMDKRLLSVDKEMYGHHFQPIKLNPSIKDVINAIKNDENKQIRTLIHA